MKEKKNITISINIKYFHILVKNFIFQTVKLKFT